MMINNKQTFQICQINISGLSQHSLIALNRYNDIIANDVLAIQETLLTQLPHSPLFPGMETYTVNNNRGVSLSLKPWLLPQNIIELQDNTTDAVWATVNLGKTIVLIGNLYINLNKNEQNNHNAAFRNICSAISYSNKMKIKEVIILGDYNGRSTSWGDTITNDNGRMLEAFITQNDLLCVSPHSKTFLCQGGGSVIDLALLKGKLTTSQYQSSSVDTDIELFSGAPTRGHLPVIHQFKLPTNTTDGNTKTPVLLYKDLKNTDWSKWQATLHDYIDIYLTPHLEHYKEPTQLWNDFIGLLNHVNDTVIPKKKVCGHSKPFWTDHLSSLSKEVQAARRKMTANYTPTNTAAYKAAKENFANSLVSEKNLWIHQKLHGLNVADSTKFWKNYKATIVGSSKDFLGNLYENGVLYADNDKKEEILFQTFFSGKHMQNGCFDDSFSTEIDQRYTEICNKNYNETSQDNDSDDPLNTTITFEEVEAAIEKQKLTAKSFDIDEIHPSIIKRFPKNALRILQVLFNLVMKTGTWIWDTSNISFIKKANKENYMKPGSYRPISITSYIGKLLEKIIDQRIRLHCEINDIIDEEQEGFRPTRNTVRYLYKMIAMLDECRKRKFTTFLLCIDFSKAFDSVWVNGLIVKLNSYNIKGNVLKVIDNFLKNRKVRIKINNVFGSPRKCGFFGVPQGSVLAPLLFILYIADIFKQKSLPIACQDYTRVFKYADDGSVAVSNIEPKNAHMVCQEMCNHLHNWCRKWKMIPNCEKNKTECVVVYPKNSTNLHSFQPPKLKIGNNEIEYVDHTTVLGLMIDKDLNFQQHATKKLTQCWFAWYKITQNCTRIWGLNASTLCILFRSIILSKLMYAAPVWMGCNLEKYKDFYARAILKISGATHHPPRDIVSIALNMAPLQTEYQLLVVKFMLKSLKSDDEMKAIIYQIEESKDHRYQQHIRALHKYLLWKSNREDNSTLTSNKSRRRNLPLPLIHQDILGYTKAEIQDFRIHTWKEEHLEDLDIPPDEGNIAEMSKLLFPRHSNRKTDTQILSLLHGHDLNFRKFRSTTSSRCTPYCNGCPNEYDDNHHRLFFCPRYNSGYRNTIIKTTQTHGDITCNLLRHLDRDVIESFRNIAQIIMERWSIL